MIFNSLQFAVFLPAVVLLYWRLPGRARTAFLLAASYLFYGTWDWRFLGLIALSTGADFLIGRRLGATELERSRKRLLITSVAINLGILASFKYFGFFVDSAVELLGRFGAESSAPVLEILLPVGISFYTFQTISYTFDVFRRRIEPTNDLLVFAVYVAYFPQLVAGPIERARNLLPQFQHPPDQPPSSESIVSALSLIALGLLKKVVLADSAAPIANQAFAEASTASSATLVLGVLAFAVQIYGDFSGYTDIARGSSRLFGIELKVNFRQPYLSRNITDFWRRWHISLSDWLRDYLYVPLGGNRNGKLATYRNLMITMLLGGLWHGAAWTFVVWGGLHGAYLMAHRWFSARRPARASMSLAGRIAGVAATFTAVCFAWIFFRAESFGEAFEVIGGILALRGSFPVADNSTLTLLLILGAMFAIDVVQAKGPEVGSRLIRRPVLAGAFMGAVAVLVAVFSGVPQVPFIYFQF